MIIDRHNYEEYFILYLDNELCDADRRIVEEFTQANPDLQEELNLLLQSKFSPDMDISFDNKEELMKLSVDGINLTNYEEWLLLNTDNELTGEQKITVENFIAENPAIEKELAIFQQTRSIPEKEIVFENKELLYRHETKTRKIGFRMWRVAAAAILLIGLSASVFMLVESKKQQEAGQLAGTNPAKVKSTDPSTANPVTATPNNSIAQSSETNTVSSITSQIENTNPSTVIQTNVNVKDAKHNTRNIATSVPEDQNVNTLANNKTKLALPVVQEESKLNIKNVESNINNTEIVRAPLTDPQPNKQLATVTPVESYPSDIQTPATVTEEDVAGINQSGKKNKFRGFFRKVTRTIEKTTNMKATDDEDRLLLAGLAIKL